MTTCLIALLMSAFGAQADPSPLPQPAAVALSATVTAGGTVTVLDGSQRVARFDVGVASGSGETARATPAISARQVEVQGHSVIVVNLPLPEPGRRLTWVGLRGRGDARLIWTGTTGAQDPDGEITREIEVTQTGIIRHQTAVNVIRCDGETPRLFPEVYDWKRSRFETLGAEPTASGAAQLQGTPGDVAPRGSKLQSGFRFTAASSSQFAADARGLTAPVALNDGDPATLWVGRPESPAGFFFTARGPNTGYGLTSLRLTMAPANHRRPARLSIRAGKAPDQQFAADLTNLRAEVVDLKFPAPVPTSCLTIVVSETTGPDGAAPAIAEIELMSELDGPDGRARLVADLARGVDCDSHLRLLRQTPDSQLQTARALLQAFASGGDNRCLVRALATALEPETTGKAITLPSDVQADVARTLAAEVGRNGAERAPGNAPATGTGPQLAAWHTLLVAAGPAASAPLLELLRNADQPVEARERAAQLLAVVNDPIARAGLIDAVGRDEGALRKSMRGIAARLPPPLVADVVAVLGNAVTAGATDRQADLLFVLAAAVTRELGAVDGASATKPALLSLLRTYLDANTAFASTARALSVLGAMASPEADATLAGFAASSADPLLRHMALSALARSRAGGFARETFQAALRDRDPRVRETAARSLAGARQVSAGPHVLASLRGERWPFVRRSMTLALAELCPGPEANAYFERIVARDRPDVRRAALVAIASCDHPRAVDLLIDTFANTGQPDPVREAAALQLARRPTPTGPLQATPRLRQVLDTVLERARQDATGISLAGAGLSAFAALDPKAATPLAVDLARSRSPSLQRMALEALGALCDPGGGRVTLEDAARDPDPWIATTARSSLARCEHAPARSGEQ